MMLTQLFTDLATSLAYVGVGIVLMGIGFALVDLLTPGRLGDLIWRQRNGNAAIVLGSGLVGTSVIVVSAILASADEFAAGLLTTSGAGLLGLLLMALAFALVDAITPGKLSEIVCDREPHPAAWVTAVTHLAIAGIVAAAIS